MWTWYQTGEMDGPAAQRFPGYSGKDPHKNDPSAENIENVGPIPRGRYSICEPADTFTHGKYVLRLIPNAANEMFGRSGFLIHGDSVVAPGTASEGCIILPLANRQAIWNSGDHALTVLPRIQTVAVDPSIEAE